MKGLTPMKCRIALIALIAFALCVWVGVSAPSAFAYQGDPIQNPNNQGFVESVLTDVDSLPTYTAPPGTNPVTGSPYTVPEVETGISEAMAAGGELPTLGLAGLSLGALYTGWKIGTPLGNFIYEKITGQSLTSSSSGLAPKWTYYGVVAPGSNGGGAGICTSSGSTGSAQNALGVGGSTLIGSSGTYPNCTIVAGAWAASGFQYSAGSGGLFDPGINTANNSVANSTLPGGIHACTSSACTTFALVQPASAMMKQLTVTPSNATEYSGAATKQNDSGWTAPSQVPNLGAAENQCGVGIDPSQWTAAQAACHAKIVQIIGARGGDTSGTPATGGTTGGSTTAALVPVYLPQPLPGETVADYVERLRSKQYLGLITVTDDPMSYPTGSPALQAQPSTITGVSVATAIPTSVPLYNPDGTPHPFPNDAPQIQDQSTSTNVTITEVPPTYSPPGGGIPSVNFPSISSPCTKFPFGVFCWITAQVNSIVTASAIPWHADVNFPPITVPGMPTFDIPDFSWDFGAPPGAAATFTSELNSLFGLIRDVLAFMLWLWGLWVYGKRKFGGKGLPDGDGQVPENIG